ncbi:MAG: 3D domain-containing protein [Lachnospiraceae bacterium]|nr:3D domain-containing protein [Lachnospiraceae bacterium]
MKKNEFTQQDIGTNIKKHMKRIGVGMVTFSLCASTLICVAQENSEPGMGYRGVMIGEEQGIDDTLDAVCKASYSEIAMKHADYLALAQLEGTERAAEDVQLAAERRKRDQAAVDKLAAQQKKTTSVTETKSQPAKEAEESEYGEYLGTFTITAYCPCAKCCGKSNGKTASGKTATAGHTIAASKQFAFGTQLVIGGKVYTVEDRGGAIKGKRIDIFFATHKAALQFGRKKMKVYRYQ